MEVGVHAIAISHTGLESIRLAGSRIALAIAGSGCMSRHMPRRQAYLPEILDKLVKSRPLPAAALLQKAVQVEARRLDLLAETDRYLTALVDEVGAPSVVQSAQAVALARRLARRAVRKVGDIGG